MTREEAIKWLEGIKEKYIHGGDEAFDDARRKAIDIAVEALQAEPVKRGRWEDTKYVNVRKCSCCQAEWGIYSIEDFDYCPTCGADMRGDKHETD